MRRAIAMTLAAALAAPIAYAHGDKPHTKIDYSKVEPTPFGIAADPKRATRVVRIDMSDKMRFTPETITVKQGETVRFLVRNSGRVLHEMVIGTMDDLRVHAEEMKKHPNMEHDEPHMTHVAPGKTGEIGWRFSQAGTFYFGCLLPGHFEAGMIGKIVVTANAANR